MTATAPGRSSRSRRVLRLSRTSTGVPATTSKPSTIGSTMVNRQPTRSVTTPPIRVPTVNPVAISDPAIPNALSRARPSGNDVVSNAIPVGTTPAAPSPCNARAVNSAAGFQASAVSTEASVNSVIPAKNTRRRPTTSPRRPNNSNSPPDGSANAVATHCNEDSPSPRSRPIAGTAMVRMEKSMPTRKLAVHRISSTSRARRSIRPSARPAAVEGAAEPGPLASAEASAPCAIL